jgi:hypothetical protein
MVRDPKAAKYRRTRLFVMTLGYSRKAVSLLTFRSSSRIWAEVDSSEQAKTASHSTWAAGMVLTTHPARNRCTS